MVHLDLNDQEREVLAHTLEVLLGDLRMEISHTDRLDFRDSLRRRKEILQRIRDQLGEIPTAPVGG